MTDGPELQFSRLLDELERWNRKVNLTAVRDREQMRVLHIADGKVASIDENTERRSASELAW